MTRHFVFALIFSASVARVAGVAAATVEHDLFMVTAGSLPNRVLRIDETTGTTIGEVPLPAGFSPGRIVAANGEDGTVWLTSIGGNRIVRLNAITGQVHNDVGFATPVRIETGETNLFVSNTSSIHRLNLDGSPANA